MLLYDVTIPVCITIAFQQSFALPWVLSFKPLEFSTKLLTCPLCLGFHIGWISFLVFHEVSWFAIVHGIISGVVALIVTTIINTARSVDEYYSVMASKNRDN